MITVDAKTREMSISENEAFFGIYSDEAVTVRRFSIPRYTDNNLDLSTFTIRVNYINAQGQNGVSLVENVNVMSGAIEFDWVIPRTATASAGKVRFVVCAFINDEEGEISNEWNSAIGIGTVKDGIEISNFTSEDAYADMLSTIVGFINSKLGDLNDLSPTLLGPTLVTAVNGLESAIKDIPKSVDADFAPGSSIDAYNKYVTSTSGYRPADIYDLFKLRHQNVCAVYQNMRMPLVVCAKSGTTYDVEFALVIGAKSYKLYSMGTSWVVLENTLATK